MFHSPGMAFTATGRPLGNRPSYWLGHIPYWAAPCLASWSIAVVVLGIRSRRSAGSPGLAAGLASVVALAAQIVRCLHYAIANGWSFTLLSNNLDPFACCFWAHLPQLAGYTIAVWWLALKSSGLRSPDRSAAGRLGCALGWCWIAMGLSGELAAWCYSLNY